MSTSTRRPPESTRTPEDTPAALARSIAALATAPVRDFIACISDEDSERDHLYQRLVERLAADEPAAWSKAKEDDVDEQLRAALGTAEAKDLFGQYVDHGTTRETIRQEAAFLLGVEVGRCVSGVTSESVIRRDANGHVVPFTPEELLEARRPNLEDVLNEAIAALRLAEALSSLLLYANGEYILPAQSTRVLARATEEATDRLRWTFDTLSGRLLTTAIEDLSAESGGAA